MKHNFIVDNIEIWSKFENCLESNFNTKIKELSAQGNLSRN